MKSFTIYDNSGTILRTGTCQDALLTAQAINSGEFVAQTTADYKTEYFLNHEKTVRPTMGLSIDKTTILANGTDSCTVTNIPVNCKVNNTDITSTHLTITNTEIGEFTLTFTCFPYLDYTVTINAT